MYYFHICIIILLTSYLLVEYAMEKENEEPLKQQSLTFPIFPGRYL